MKPLQDLPGHDIIGEFIYWGSPQQVSLFRRKMLHGEFFPETSPFGEFVRFSADNYHDRKFERALMCFENRCPTWPEMVKLKDFFWYTHDIVIQVHPRKSEYVNVIKHALHLWLPTDAQSLRTLQSVRMLTQQALSMLQREATSSELFFRKIHFSGKTLVAIFGGTDWPTWEEVCSVKKHCFGEDHTALQFNICKELDLNSRHILLLWDAEDFPIALPKKEYV